MKIDKKNLPPVIAALVWALISVVSIFTVNISLLGNFYSIVSIIARLLLPAAGIIFIKKAYIDKSLTSVSYGHYQNIIGYAVTLTYVLYMLPSAVANYYRLDVELGVLTGFVLVSTLSVSVFYLLIRSAKFKLISGYFKESQVRLNKKDKKKYKKGLRKFRTPVQNAWFEFFDPLLWAIILILIINTFLFQHYQIPSPSMVSEFLEKDRVFSAKTLHGVKLPLTNYRLPEIAEIEVGDIVTFYNPEVDDPESEIHYNSLTSKLFHPFIFYLTFSAVDIDKKENGEPKERELVKRAIGMPGEKISMVNDKVYKKIDGGEWTLMSEIPGEEEWGESDLFYLDNPNSGWQYINPALRESLDEAARLVIDSDADNLEKSLIDKKREFLEVNNYVDDSVVESINENISVVNQDVTVYQRNFKKMYIYMMQLNLLRESNSGKKKFVEDFNSEFEKYNRIILLDQLELLSRLINSENPEEDITTDLNIKPGASPYEEFSIKLNSLIKLRKLEVMLGLLKGNDFEEALDQLTSLLIYTRGFEFEDFTISFFGSGNLPEFPVGENNYINEGEYFLMGDNRYNSKDSRMGNSEYTTWLTDDHSLLAEKIKVGWDPHTIHEDYIHGRIVFRGFPFSRIKLFW